MIQLVILFIIVIILVSIHKINSLEAFQEKKENEKKHNLYNELKLRILNEDYVKNNLNKLKLNEKLNLINKLSEVPYYLPLDIFKDRRYKESSDLIENRKLALQLSDEIINYYLRGFHKSEITKFINILKKQKVYIPIIYFNNLSYLNSIKFIQKLLNPSYKYPLNYFEENKLNSKLVFNKNKNKDIQKYFKGINFIQRSIGNNKVNIIPNTKLRKPEKSVDILKEAIKDNQLIIVNKKLSPEQKLKEGLNNLEDKVIMKLSNNIPKNKVNFDKIVENIKTNKNYIVSNYNIDLLQKNNNYKEKLLLDKNNKYDI